MFNNKQPQPTNVTHRSKGGNKQWITTHGFAIETIAKLNRLEYNRNIFGLSFTFYGFEKYQVDFFLFTETALQTKTIEYILEGDEIWHDDFVRMTDAWICGGFEWYWMRNWVRFEGNSWNSKWKWLKMGQIWYSSCWNRWICLNLSNFVWNSSNFLLNSPNFTLNPSNFISNSFNFIWIATILPKILKILPEQH